MTRLMQLFAGVLILFAGGLLSTTLQAKTHYGDGFSIDLDDPYDRVLEVAREVAADGIIRGTSEYKGTSELDSAVPQNSSNAFHAWTEGGTILYKVKRKTLSPEHFYESNDKGTVTVRYELRRLARNLRACGSMLFSSRTVCDIPMPRMALRRTQNS